MKTSVFKRSYILLLIVICIMTSFDCPARAILSETPESNEAVSDIEGTVSETKRILTKSDVPEMIDFASASEKGHVARLREKETDEHTIVFLNQDNTETMYVFPEPIKYTDNDGNIKEKSTSLTFSKNAYTTVNNDINISFPQNIQQGVSVSKDDICITMTPISTDGLSSSKNNVSENATKASNNQVLYKDVFGTNIDVRYTALYSGFKEDILLKEFSNANRFVFEITTNGLYLRKNPDGSVSFCVPQTNEVAAEMMPIVCVDANQRFGGGDVTITEVTKNQHYTITVIPDQEFLEDTETAYPVAVDPTITLNTTSAIEDAIIYSGTPNTNYGNYSFNYIGYHDEVLQQGRLMVRFPTLVSNGLFSGNNAIHVTNATYSMYTSGDGNSTSYIRAYGYNRSAWTESTVTWNSVTVGSTMIVLNEVNIPSAAIAKMSFDVTPVVQAWASGTTPVHTPSGGLLFMNTNQTSQSAMRGFISTEHAAVNNTSWMPCLEVTYIQLTLNETSISLAVEETFNLNHSYAGLGYSTTWTSNYENIASVSNSGKVTALSIGNVTITLTVKNSSGNTIGTASCNVSVIPADGTYQIRNVSNMRFLQIGTGVMEVRPQTASIQQRFVLTHIGDNYFKITSAENELALTAPPIAGQVTLTTYTGADTQKWKFYRSSNNTNTAKILIQSKSSQSSSTSAYTRLTIADTDDDYRLLQASVPNNFKEWVLYKLYDVSLLAVAHNDGADRSSQYEQIATCFNRLNYDSYNNHETIENGLEILEFRTRLTTSKITIIHTHGSQDHIVLTDGDHSIDNIPTLNNLDLVIYGSCEAAKDGKNGINLVTKTANQGARTSIGFVYKISNLGFNYWSVFFSDYYTRNFYDENATFTLACQYALQTMRNSEIYREYLAGTTINPVTNEEENYNMLVFVVAGEESFNN